MMFEKLLKIIKPVDENVISMNINRLLEDRPLNEIIRPDQKRLINLQPSNLQPSNLHKANALRRKKYSQGMLKGLGLSVDVHLPVIEDEGQAIIRSQTAIVERCVALLVVAAKGEGLDQEFIDRLMYRYDVSKMLTPMEEHFVTAMEPSESEYIRFIWRYEAVWVMLWALNYVDTLDLPLNLCDVEYAIHCLQSRSIETFQEEAELRGLSDLLDEADLAMRYHSAVISAEQISNAKRSGSIVLNTGVVQERYIALMWLVGHDGLDWDGLTFGN